MASCGGAPIRPPEPITITVCRVRNMRGPKGETLNVFLKMDFGDRVLGESPKMDCALDSPTEFNFSITITCTYDDSSVLDELAYKPLVVTVTEVLPKDKKAKEEKMLPLGQCSVDLLPLFKGETVHNCTLTIHPLPGSPLESLAPEHGPEMDIMLAVDKPLLNEEQLKAANIMTVTIESLFSPPETWQYGGHASQFHYAAAMPVPSNAENENLLVFTAGEMKPSPEKEVPCKMKRWPEPGTAVGNAVFIPDSYLSCEPIEDEEGDFRSKEDRRHRQLSESEKVRVTWNTERRCYLENNAVQSLLKSVAACRYWPLEIFRLPQLSSANTKPAGKGAEGSDTVSFHGIAFPDLGHLLYPGVKRIRGAFKVLPFSEQLLNEKTKREYGMVVDATKLAMSQLYGSSPSPKKSEKGAKDKAPDKADKPEPEKKNPKGKAVGKSSVFDSTLETEQEPPVNAEGRQYEEAKSYIMVDIRFSRPPVPKRTSEEMARRVAEIIPPRPLFPQRTNSAERAVSEFHGQVQSVAALILEEFSNQFGEEIKGDGSQTAEAMEKRRYKLMHYLNTSGKYFAFKEQLKCSITKIVREKYLRTTDFKDRQELQTFLSELYVYLVDQMHQVLNSFLQFDDQPPIPESQTSDDQLKHFAKEAEVNQNFELAIKYYQERIIRDDHNADFWFDFGTFYLGINNIPKAEECFNQCVANNQRHFHGLIMYGVVCALQERIQVAETFFEAATCVEPKNILAWVMMSLFFEFAGNDLAAEMTLLEANRLYIANVAALIQAQEEEMERERLERERRMEEEKEKENEAVYTADDIEHQDRNSPSSSPSGSKKSAVLEKLPVGSTHSKNVHSAGTTQSKNISSKPPKGQADSKQPRSVATDAAEKQGPFGKNRAPAAPEEVEEEAAHREFPQIQVPSIYIQAVGWLLEVKAIPFAESALARELLLTQVETPSYRFALARLRFQKQEYDLAERELEAALQVEYQNADGWALLGHVKFFKGEMEEARSCYERTLAFVTDAREMHPIYLRLGSIYKQIREFAKAKETFMLACKKAPSSVSWLGVGIACYRLGELTEAEDALMEANILNNTDAEVWAYLSLVCLYTGRKVEAEQSFKHAVKLNLQDRELLNEIREEQKKFGFGNPEF